MLDIELIKEQLSIAFVHAIATKAGFTVDKPTIDNDSVDLVISVNGKIDTSSVIASPRIEVQLKASSSLTENEGKFHFQLSRKNYNDLRATTALPRLLVFFNMPESETDWVSLDLDGLTLKKAAFYLSLAGAEELVDGSASRVVHIPTTNHLTVESLKALMLKASKLETL